VEFGGDWWWDKIKVGVVLLGGGCLGLGPVVFGRLSVVRSLFDLLIRYYRALFILAFYYPHYHSYFSLSS